MTGTTTRLWKTAIATVSADLLVAGLAGCGDSSSTGSDGDGQTTVTIAVRAHFADQMQQAIAQYEKLHPDVTLTTQTLPDDNTQYLQRLVTQRLGGKLPDVIESIDTLVNQLAANKITTDLTPYLAKQQNGVSAPSFLPHFLDAYRPIADSTRIEGLPVGADAYVLYYNEDLFAQYGVALPTDSWTFDDMYAAARQITQAAHGQAFGMVQTDLQQGEYNPVIDAFGGYVYNRETDTSGIGEPAAIEAWKYMLKPYQDGTFALLFRQFFLSLPTGLIEAARLDGAGWIRTLWSIAAPLARPAIAAYASITFLNAWNDYIWPLISAPDDAHRVMSVALAPLATGQLSNIPPNVGLAAAVISTVPVLLAFLFAQRWYVQGIVGTGVDN